MLPLPQSITDFLNIFKKNKYQVYVVGGAIRELLLGHTIDNWDFATNATPQEILKLYPNGIYENKYGTVLIPVETFRRDVSTNEHRISKNLAKDFYPLRIYSTVFSTFIRSSGGNFCSWLVRGL